MAEIHSATASPLATELVEDACRFVNGRIAHESNQAAQVGRTKEEAVRLALLSVIEDMSDHLHIDFALTLAANALTEGPTDGH